MRKHRPHEHVCTCNAYGFPHRFGGGKCSGAWIAEKTWNKYYGAGPCDECMCNNDIGETAYCEVVEGQEGPQQCPVWQEYVAKHEIKVYLWYS
jgi:hypothetical protein